MLKGSAMRVFDGPRFSSWRISHLQHNALARLAEDHVFVAVVRKGEVRLRTI